MDIRNVLKFILAKYEKDEEVDDKIIKEIQDVIIEMEAAESMFNNVEDSQLIEAAIYREEAAKKKFDYLLSIAKERYAKDIDSDKEMEI